MDLLTNPETSIVAAHESACAVLARVAEQIGRALVGQQEVVEHVLMALFAGGHVLLEGVPGLGKTLLVRTLAKTFGGAFARIQFTPDLMPSDVTGHALYDLKSLHIEPLREAVKYTRANRPFHIDAWVVLPDHMHCALPYHRAMMTFPIALKQ